MKNLLFFILFIPGMLFSQQYDIVGNTNNFGFDLFRKIQSTTTNVVFSPYSISTALTMTNYGARTETEKQIMNVLHQKSNEKGYHNEFAANMKLVSSKKNITLNIANAIWAQKGYAFEPDFLAVMKDTYNSKAESADFVNNAENERLKINQWVEKQTNNKIKNLLSQGVINALTRMVIVNAVYFYGNWHTEFDKSRTFSEKFHKTENQTINCKYMFAERKFDYSENTNFQMLIIPYKNEEASLLLFLPKVKNNLSNVISKFTQKEYSDLLNARKKEEVELWLPKFKIESGFNLSDALIDMGMPLAFTDNADFSGLSADNKLKISKVIHKAFIELDEKGTEAAAATAVIITTKSAHMNDFKVYFKATHPFIFVLKDNKTNLILFMGVVVNPE